MACISKLHNRLPDACHNLFQFSLVKSRKLEDNRTACAEAQCLVDVSAQPLASLFELACRDSPMEICYQTRW